MYKYFIILFLALASILPAEGQKGSPMKVPGYKFIKRIKGPVHKKSKVLEIMIDKYNNYFAATFEAEKSRFIYVGVYRLYSWEEIGLYKLDVNRAELYCSVFDPDGNYFYLNTDIFKNTFLKIDLKTGEISEASCSETPNNCKKIEPEQYQTEGYTIGENYYIFRDDNLKNYIRIFVKKELFIPEMVQPDNPVRQPSVVQPKIKEITITDEELQMLSTDGVLTIQGTVFNYIDPAENKTANTANTSNSSGKIILTPDDFDKLVMAGTIDKNGIKIILKKTLPSPDDKDNNNNPPQNQK